jgi:hypothetical protein
MNLSARWHLNSRCVPMPPVPWEGLERVQEIRRRRALLPPHLRCDPTYAIASPNRDTFSAWEWEVKRHASYFGDVYWDRQWVPEASPDDNDKDDKEEDNEEGVGVQAEQPPPPPPRVTGEVSH